MSDTVNISDIDYASEDTSTHRRIPAPAVEGFRFGSLYGETSTAAIWSATQISLDRPVTVWVMRPDRAADASKAEHFDAVARAAAHIQHLNLVQVIDVSRTADGLPFAVFENIDGANLAQILHREGRLEPERAMRITLELASALDAAWKQIGFIHRNIKPENILLADNRTVKITNFGSATLVTPGANPLAYDDDLMVGTPNYASPEQIECDPQIDFRTDIYGAGALLYQMITGHAPFAEENDPMRMLYLQIHGTLPSPSDMEPPVALSVSRLIQKMMAKSPADRYAFWQDVIEDIRRVLAGRPLFAETSGKYAAPSSTIADPTNPARLIAAGKNAPRRPAGYIVTKTSATSPASQSIARNQAPGCVAVFFGALIILVSMFITAYFRVNNLEKAEQVPLPVFDESE